MQADHGYVTTRFEALRLQLGALNEDAIADGLVAVRDGVVVMPERRRPRQIATKALAIPGKATKRADRSPASARRLLALLHRQKQDESPDVAGTRFTEDGVARLVAHLRARQRRRGNGAWAFFLQRAGRYLARPVPQGIRMVHGVGFERLLVLARQLEEIESGGWARFRAARAVRRRKVAPATPLTRDELGDEPSKRQRKGAAR